MTKPSEPITCACGTWEWLGRYWRNRFPELDFSHTLILRKRWDEDSAKLDLAIFGANSGARCLVCGDYLGGKGVATAPALHVKPHLVLEIHVPGAPVAYKRWRTKGWEAYNRYRERMTQRITGAILERRGRNLSPPWPDPDAGGFVYVPATLVRLYEARDSDPDNMLKTVFEALVHARAIPDDSARWLPHGGAVRHVWCVEREAVGVHLAVSCYALDAWGSTSPADAGRWKQFQKAREKLNRKSAPKT